MPVPAATTPQAEIRQIVDEVKAEFRTKVAEIFFSIDEDWSGDRALFFRVVLRDAAIRKFALDEITIDIRNALSQRVEPLNLGLFLYFSFRSASEQRSLGDEAWA